MSPATLLRPWQAAAALVAAALLFGACSPAGSEPDPTEPAAPNETAPASPTDSSTAGATPTETATPSPTPSATGPEADAVIAAAIAALDARHVSPLTRDACLEDNDEGQVCVELVSGEEDLAGGIAKFDAGDPASGPFTFFMGRDANGEWHYWFGTQQQTYILQSVPGTLLACRLDEPATIRAEPTTEADAVMTLENQDELVAEAFVLTAPGTFGARGERGDGWYRVSSPAEGWIEARQTTDAAHGDCLLHDAIEQTAHG